MDDLKIHLELTGCYGIESLFEEITFHRKGNIFSIYAPNGTMKTSLTKTINDTIENEDTSISKDKINKNVKYNRDLKFNNEKLSYKSKNVLVLKSYDFFKGDVSLEHITISNKNRIKNVIDLFNERFSLPFEVVLKNNKIIFIHKKSKIEYDKLKKDFLSFGEQKSFYIFEILIKIEDYKYNSEIKKQPFLVILDDIADSFDYKNKYSIIEYIHELKDAEYLRVLILTHSFDFFSSLNTRINLGLNKFIAMKNEDDKLKFIKIKDRELKLNHFINKIDNYGDLILSIPINRTLLEYENNKNDIHKKLTFALHYKRATLDMHIIDIFNIDNIRTKTTQSFKDSLMLSDLDYLEALFIESSKIIEEKVTEDNLRDMLIKNKIILCMAIRIKTEQLAKVLLSMRVSDNKEQLGSLFKKIQNTIPRNEIKIYRKSTLLTPELIHLDLLNYSLMMDLSIQDLIFHYKDILQYELENKYYLKKLQEKKEKENSLYINNIEKFFINIKVLAPFKEYEKLIKIDTTHYNPKILKNIIKADERRNKNKTLDKIEEEFYDIFFENDKYLKKLNEFILKNK